ncbi:hypothetical protein [Corynebacterium nuruki]|uniref:hypothetical protein n=1 Tax=Corynebacterium nuruki TaxID=1032851 RepID=UPI002FE076EA
MNTTALMTPARRIAAGFLAALIAVFGIMGATAPKASAQVDPITGGLAAATTLKAVCETLYGDDAGGLAGCLDKVKDSALDAKDVTECLLKDEDEGGDTGGETEAPTPGDGDETEAPSEGTDFGSKLDDCLKDDEEEEEETVKQPDDYSLYRMTSALTAFYVNSLVPGGFDADSGSDSGDSGDSDSDSGDDEGGATAEDTEEGAKGLSAWSCVLNSPSMAGAVMAKPNKDNLENKNWLLGYGDANNDAVFTYKAFDRSDDPTYATATATDGCAGRLDLGGRDSSLTDAGVGSYAYYGATLAGLGYDQTEARDSMDSAKAHMMGYGMMLAFMGAGAVDTIFDSVLNLLQTLNPFALIFQPITDNTDATFTQGMRGDGDTNSDGAFDGLVDFLSRMYAGFYNLGWEVTIPVFIGIFVAGALLFRRYAIGDGAKKLVIRIAFLVLGVPLLGVTYTSALDSMQGASGESATANAAKIVNSTYVDFEGWTNSRLALPAGQASSVAWDLEASRPTEGAQITARQTAMKINTMVHPGLAELGGAAAADTDASWVTDNMDNDDKSDNGVYGTTLSLLNRYISGDRVSAAGFESEVKGELSRLANENPGQESMVLGWVKDLSSADTLAGMTADDVANLHNPVLQVQGTGLSVQRDTSHDGRSIITFTAPNSDATAGSCGPSTITAPGAAVADDPSILSSCPMSVLSMYNYLNTRFDTTAATTFSPASSTSSWAREQHQSVNAVGSGITSMVYWFSAMALLVSFMLIGVFYALAMMFGTLKRGIQLIAAIPFATMGFLAGIGKVIVYTISMFLEIFMTIFLFKVVQELLMVVPQVLDTKVAEAADSSDSIFGGLASTTGVMLMTIVTAFVVLFFTFQAIKLRSSIIQALDEAATNVVNKILGTNVSAGASASDGGAIKQGIARGAALGGASWFMGRNSADGDSGDSGNGVAAAAGAAAGDAGTPTEGGMTGMPDPTAPQDIENAGDQGGDIENADNVDASDGQLPAGDYDVDADGNVTSSDGSIDTDGATLGDVANVDADGNILGSNGQPIPGPDGQPLQAGDVKGIDSHGNMIGADGQPLLDQNGGTVAAGGVGSVDAGGTGYAESAFADETPGDVASTEAQAAHLAQSGLTQPTEMSEGGGTAYGVSGDTGTAETAEFPAQGAGVAGTAAAGFAGARAGQFGNSAEVVSNGGAEMGQGYKTLTGQSNVSGGPAAGPQASVPQGQQGYSPQAQMPSQGAPGAPGQAAPVAGQGASTGTAGETQSSRGTHPVMGMIGMQMANGAVNKAMGQTTTGRNVHESISGKPQGGNQQGAGGFNGLNQAGRSARTSRGSRSTGNAGNTMATMAGMQAMNQWGRNGNPTGTGHGNQTGNAFGVDPNAAMRRPDGSLDPRANGSGNPGGDTHR